MTSPGSGGWPQHLRPGAIRIAWASGDYEETIAYYRDLVGLTVVGSFADSYGEDGTLFGLPDTSVVLEIVRRPIESSPAGAFDQLVLYFDNAAAVDEATGRLTAAGIAPKPDPHPYWAANGAVIYRDPDGRDVVFAPWVFGRDLSPTELDSDPG